MTLDTRAVAAPVSSSPQTRHDGVSMAYEAEVNITETPEQPLRLTGIEETQIGVRCALLFPLR